MIDEATKKKYQILQQLVIKLNHNLGELSIIHKKLINEMNDTVKLNNTIIEKDTLKKYLNINENNYKKINNIVLPSINQKIN